MTLDPSELCPDCQHPWYLHEDGRGCWGCHENACHRVDPMACGLCGHRHRADVGTICSHYPDCQCRGRREG